MSYSNGNSNIWRTNPTWQDTRNQLETREDYVYVMNPATSKRQELSEYSLYNM